MGPPPMIFSMLLIDEGGVMSLLIFVCLNQQRGWDVPSHRPHPTPPSLSMDAYYKAFASKDIFLSNVMI